MQYVMWTEKRLKKQHKQFDCRFFTDYREMLMDKSIDAVHICTPHYLHAQMAIEAMESGKHVLTEKPMSISVADAIEMNRISSLKPGKCWVYAFQNRYNDTSLRIKDVLQAGKLGEYWIQGDSDMA